MVSELTGAVASMEEMVDRCMSKYARPDEYDHPGYVNPGDVSMVGKINL